MRNCPVCESSERNEIWNMNYRVPDNWPLPSKITWFTCASCGMLYGDGDFNQATLDEYYSKFYGYGINSLQNVMRLTMDAVKIETLVKFDKQAVIVDFGGAGDDGKSIVVGELKRRGFTNAICSGVGDTLPANCDLIYASHVIEHIYDLPQTMTAIVDALKPDGLLIMDVPDSIGLLLRWNMPMLDFNTKHINHFTLLDCLRLGRRYGMEAVKVVDYNLNDAPAVQVHFKKMDMAEGSSLHIAMETSRMIDKLRVYEQDKTPVNIWGMGDITWHLLSMVDLNVLNYIDNDPAYRGQTYRGQPVLERPDNGELILILAQGQRKRLIENIRRLGITNQIVEI